VLGTVKPLARVGVRCQRNRPGAGGSSAGARDWGQRDGPKNSLQVTGNRLQGKTEFRSGGIHARRALPTVVGPLREAHCPMVLIGGFGLELEPEFPRAVAIRGRRAAHGKKGKAGVAGRGGIQSNSTTGAACSGPTRPAWMSARK
jgi:hypothetical protein